MKQPYRNSYIVIAGGGSGMGLELCAQLSRQGASIVVFDKNISAVKDCSMITDPSGGLISGQIVDMTISNQVTAAVDAVIKMYGRIDYFFNCVGIVQGGAFKDTPIDDVHDVVQTNIDAVINGTYYAYQHMLRQKSGHIINFASAAGLLPTPYMTSYTASKYAIVGFSHALRAEAKANGVRVSVVCPGFVKTPLYETGIYNNLDKDKTIDLLFNKLPIQTPAAAAKRIIKGVSNNRSTIHTWHSLRLAWFLYRLFPNGYIVIISKLAKPIVQMLSDKPATL